MDRFGGWSTCFVEINNGRFAVGWPNWSGNLSMGFGSPAKWQTSDLMGFYIEKSFITIPFWFLTVLSALLLWFLWKKSRPRPRGFPVTTV
jgi:hypothetical protein